MGKKQIAFQTARNILVGLLLLILGSVVGYRFGLRNQSPMRVPLSSIINTTAPQERENVDFNTFWEVWGYLENDYIEPEKLDAREMVNGAIGGMTAAIGDPYTAYLPPDDNKHAAEDLAGAFFGVGIELGYVDGVLAVVSPVKGTPAEAAGVQPGDLILHVKDTKKGLDEDTNGWTLDEAVENIRGEKGSDVTLTLLRKKDNETAEPFDVTMQRGEIVVESVEVAFVEHAGKKAAHLKISRFGERTETEFEQAVQTILSQRNSISGIVLDLRNNPGGFFDGAIDVSSEFIEDGTVVTQKGKFLQKSFPAEGRARLAGIPVEVLVNGGSASAAEIVAGALRDEVGAKLIGEKTFGKGTVQDRRSLTNGGGLHVTIARWLLPKGDWIHDEGIPVNVEVKDDPATADKDEALLRAIEEL
jgi:carboxyl-terminal processing protease